MGSAAPGRTPPDSTASASRATSARCRDRTWRGVAPLPPDGVGAAARVGPTEPHPVLADHRGADRTRPPVVVGPVGDDVPEARQRRARLVGRCAPRRPAGRGSWRGARRNRGSERVASRGASTACCGAMPKAVMLSSTCSIACCWTSPPGVPKAMKARPSRSTSEGAGVSRGRLPPATSLAWPGMSQPCEPRGETTQPTPGMTGESTPPGSLGRGRERVALRVDHRDVGSVERARVRRRADRATRPPWPLRTAALPSGSPGGRHVGPRAILADQAAAQLGVGLRQQRLRGHLHEARIAVVGLAVGEGELHRLHHEVQAARACCGRARASRTPRSGSASGGRPAPGTRSRTRPPRSRGRWS